MILSFFLACIALVCGLFLLRLYSPLYKVIFIPVMICWAGHMLGTYFYASLGSDSLGYYFPYATSGVTKILGDSGSGHMLNIVWYIREMISGDSFLATMYVFGVLTFCGSVLWYCIFLKVSEMLSLKNSCIYRVPAFIILCWPTFLIFSAGMKDAVVFFCIPLFFISLISFQGAPKKILSILGLMLGAWGCFFVRSYLTFILIAAWYIADMVSYRRSVGVRILFAFAGFVLAFVLLRTAFVTVLHLEAHVGELAFNYTAIAQRAIAQQSVLNIGSVFSLPTHNPMLLIFFLPYSFIMNLCFPLFFYANNFLALFSSFENLFLVYLIFYFIKHRHFFVEFSKKIFFTNLLFYYFIAGMSFLALINTNLGLSTREKAMYLPAFLVVVSLVYVAQVQQRQKKLKELNGDSDA